MYIHMCIDNSVLDGGLEIDAEVLQVKLVSINGLFNFIPLFFFFFIIEI
jgi:hypothetical protein